MNKLEKRKPDLVSYLSDSTAYSKYTQTALEPNSVLQTVISDIYADKNLKKKIGSRSHTTTIYDVKNKENIKKNLFKQLNSSTTYLPQGTINTSTTYELRKNKEGIYNPPSGKFFNTISYGSGAFFGKKGYFVEIVDRKTSISEVLIYFDKN